MTYIFDIDGTVLFSRFENEQYFYVKANEKVVEKINQLYMVNTIIMCTGRHWKHYGETVNHLMRAGVKYHTLIMGRPPGIYVDDQSMKPEEFLSL